LKAGQGRNILPSLIERRAKSFVKYRSFRPQDIQLFEKEVVDAERMLQHHEFKWPFFIKVDAWKAYSEHPDLDLWVLERMGWGKWKRRHRFLYVMEGITIPKMQNAEVISVNSMSPPFLTAAEDLRWSDQIVAEDVQASQLDAIPNAIKEKAYPMFEECLYQMGETIIQMEKYEEPFSEFIDQKIDEYLGRVSTISSERKASDAIEKHFRVDRRVELFYEFLEEIELGKTE